MKTFRQSYYDFFSRFYDRFVSMHSRASQGAVKGFLAELMSLGEGERVLDICCGTGSLLLELCQRTGPQGLSVGLDFSGGMLEAAGRKTSVCPGICLVQADAAQLPFPSGSFDAVTCTHAFYELGGSAQEMALREIVRVLKPGKAFFMVEHDLPETPLIRVLFYIRLASMGLSKAIQILRTERNTFERYFSSVEKIRLRTGRSKVFLCRR